MHFAFFPLQLSKVLRLPRKIDARSYEVLHLSRQIILANLQIRCSKMQPLSGNQRPDLLTSLMNMSFVLRLPWKMHLCRSSSNVPRLPSFLEMRRNTHVLLTFDKVHNPLRLPRETSSECPPTFSRICIFFLLTCTKHTILGPLLAVEMSKKCTPWWREAHLEVKMYETLGVRTTFGSSDLEKVHAVVARSTF